MFLSQLSLTEKENFFALINLIVNCDGEYSETEKIIISEYQKEMGIGSIKNISRDIDEVINSFERSSQRIKNIVFLESIALILSDEKYENAEKEIVEKMMAAFGISEELKERHFKWVDDIQKLYRDVQELI